ncbi:hypothetical protein FSOLCH5_012345 [Fusarium solani]
MKVIGVFAFVAGASAFLAPRSPTKAPYHVPEGFELAADEYIVVLHDNHTIDDHLTNTGLNLTERAISFNPFNIINAYHLSVQEEDSAFIHDIIRHDPGVAYVHHNYYTKEEIPKISGDVVKRDFIPDDPNMDKRWNKQTRKRWTSWNMAMISSGWMQRTSESAGDPHERERRDFGTDLDKAHEAIWKYHPGPGVNIYVFDTGIRLSHNIFSKYTGLEKKVRNFGDLKSEDQSPFCPPGWTMDDDRGHGTHVAGIAAGTANSSAFDAHIVNVKMFCESTSEQKARAVDAVVAEHLKFKANSPWDGWRGSVINWSMDSGIPPSDDILQRALQKAADAGIPIAAAAGNFDKTRLAIPARYKSTFSVGAVNIKYDRWITPARGILPQSSSHHNKKLDVFAPGELVESASTNCDSCYVRHNGTSMAAPHVAGIMAIMVDYEGWENLDHADRIYERLKENALPYVNIDASMKKAETTNLLVQSGITMHEQHPYRGVVQDRQIPPDNTPWGPGGIPIRRGRTRRQEQDDGNWPDLPKQQVEPHPDSDRWMIDGDMSGYKPTEPDSFACFGLQTNRYVNRDVLVGNIEHFCETAQARARPDPGSKFISTVYNGGTPNEVMLIIDYEAPDIDYEIGQEDCVFYLKDIVLDRCDSSSKDNPGNWKAGGVAHKDKIGYRIEPLKERNSWAGCKVDRRNVRVWGGGWSTTDSGKRLIEEAKNCGIDAGSPKFNYGGGDDNREWTAEMNGASDVDDKCISEAIEKAGGPKVTCEKTAPPPPPPKPFEPKYDCQGSGLCGGPLLQVKHCDYAVNRLRRNRADPTWYGTQERRLTGNCWAKSDGIGCGVFIEGSGCELIGDDIWEYYQKIRSSCKKCGKVEYKAGCFVKIDYVTGCNNHD